MSAPVSRQDRMSPDLVELLEYIRAELAQGEDISLTWDEATELMDEFDRRGTRPHPDACGCDDCVAIAMEEAAADTERELNEQQADEDRAQEQAENGVLPWE